jgi:hypothetical protein
MKHASSPLWSDYFGDRVLFFAWTAILKFSSSYLCWDDKHTTAQSFFSIEMGLAVFIFPYGLQL